MSNAYYHDYENEPIGGGNPYWRCVHCKRSDPEINGELEGHDTDCAYRLKKEAELRMKTPGDPVADALAVADAHNDSGSIHTAMGRMAPHCLPGEQPMGAALRILATEVRRLNKEACR